MPAYIATTGGGPLQYLFRSMRFPKTRTLVCIFTFLISANFELKGLVDTALVIEAEDAAIGSVFNTTTEGGVTYITPSTTFTGTYPTSADTVAKFTVTFPEAGDYELYARIYVGPASASDDSMITANALGNASIGNSAQWSMANGLYNTGFSNPDDLILSVGETGEEKWKWIRLSTFSEVGLLTVPTSQLTQTYKIASREDGFRIDKIAFGPARVTFTVNQIENGLPGLDQRQPNDGEDFQSTGPILAHGKSKFLGSVWSGTSAYNKDFEFYWNGMWHGNAGKWGSVESTRDSMNWTVVDEGYNFAKAHNVAFNFHILLWGAQQPGWISALEPDEQLEEIREWMEAVAERYPDIDYLQVVNEPINAPPTGELTRADYADALGGTGETGFDWILGGFRLAREIFPGVPLMINEYNIEGNPERSDQYLKIIEALQAEDLIDLVGFQGHAFSTKFSSVEVMESILDKIAGTGLPIMITEMEIDGHDDFVQLAEYKRVFPIYWDHPSVIGINISGHIGNWRYDEGAYLVNDNFTERLALKWLREYVADAGWDSYEGYLDKRNLNPDTHAISNDFDHDSLPTGLEYLLGLDPETSEAGILIWNWDAGASDITFPLSKDVLHGIVEIQASVDMKTWETQASYDAHFRVADGLTVVEDQGTRTLRFEGESNSSQMFFYRIKYTSTD